MRCCCTRVYTDHNADNTSAVLREWTKGAEAVYNRVVLHEMEEWVYHSRAPYDWHEERYLHVSKLRQEALDTARLSGADFLMVSINSYGISKRYNLIVRVCMHIYEKGES